MDFLDSINSNPVLSLLALPLTLCILVMLLNSDHRETSGLAVKNTLATLGMIAVNIVFLGLLLPSVNETAQTIYDVANIPTLPSSVWNSTPWVLTALVTFITIDISDYSIHRLMHRKWFWPTHAAHHSDTHVNAFTTFRIHFLEGLLMSVSYLVLFTWIQLPSQLPLALLVGRLFNMYVHMDLPWDHGRFRHVLASPVYHRWHHADTPAAHGKNLCNMFPILDIAFGTYYPAEVTDVPMGATSSNIADVNPLKIAVYPFMQWGRLVRGQWHKLTASPSPEPAARPDEPTSAPEPEPAPVRTVANAID